MDELILHTISNVGVPAAVCFYSLFYLNRSMQKLTDAIEKLSNKVDKIDKLELKVEKLENIISKLV